jgi:hypothetical protein
VPHRTFGKDAQERPRFRILGSHSTVSYPVRKYEGRMSWGPVFLESDLAMKTSVSSATALKSIATAVALLGCVFWLVPGHAAENTHQGDVHYTEAGFFDLHVCNWPDRPPFYMAVFSTRRFGEVSEVEVYRPDGRLLGRVDMSTYTPGTGAGKPEKRIYITHFAIPTDARDGWYTARIGLSDGRRYLAKDFVIHSLLPLAGGFYPGDGVELPDPPVELSWRPVAGAQRYMVTIRDRWQDDRNIYTSSLLSEPKLVLPPNLLTRGGWYAWRVHARDVNEHTLLGDFNHGSLSEEVSFTIAPP